jgi:hypothetical protein
MGFDYFQAMCVYRRLPDDDDQLRMARPIDPKMSRVYLFDNTLILIGLSWLWVYNTCGIYNKYVGALSNSSYIWQCFIRFELLDC